MELHELKIRLQRHFTDGLVTVVGSGLSCAEGLPGMPALAEHLSATINPDALGEDREIWSEIIGLIASLGLEAALLIKKPTASIETEIAAKTASFIIQHEKKVIAEVFRGARVLRFTRLLKHLMKPSDRTGLPVITTNYDRLVEIAAEEAGLGVDNLFVGRFAGRLDEKGSLASFCRDVDMKRGGRARLVMSERVNIFKPHGSLDWYLRAGKPVSYTGDLDVPRLIITPGSNKFRNGYDSPFDKHREKANKAIDEARRFLVLGYGFNDDHLETHLTPRIMSGVPTLLLTRSLSDNALRLSRECRNVIAIQCNEMPDQIGTSVLIDGATIFYPNIKIWDLEKFIAEVLEP